MRRPDIPQIAIDKFWSRVAKGKDVDDCWKWLGGFTGFGTPDLHWWDSETKKTFRRSARRISYCLFHGKVPISKEISSLCLNRACVNPEHVYDPRNIEETLKYKAKENAVGCLIWQGPKSPEGYGRLNIHLFGTDRVHKAVYQHHKGKVPKGLVVRHTCDNSSCCNIKHLVMGTHLDNGRDAAKRRARSGYEKFTEEEKKQIKKDHQKLGSIRQTALKWGCSHGTITRIIYNCERTTIHRYHFSPEITKQYLKFKNKYPHKDPLHAFIMYCIELSWKEITI